MTDSINPNSTCAAALRLGSMLLGAVGLCTVVHAGEGTSATIATIVWDIGVGVYTGLAAPLLIAPQGLRALPGLRCTLAAAGMVAAVLQLGELLGAVAQAVLLPYFGARCTVLILAAAMVVQAMAHASFDDMPVGSWRFSVKRGFAWPGFAKPDA